MSSTEMCARVWVRRAKMKKWSFRCFFSLSLSTFPFFFKAQLNVMQQQTAQPMEENQNRTKIQLPPSSVWRCAQCWISMPNVFADIFVALEKTFDIQSYRNVADRMRWTKLRRHKTRKKRNWNSSEEKQYSTTAAAAASGRWCDDKKIEDEMEKRKTFTIQLIISTV